MNVLINTSLITLEKLVQTHHLDSSTLPISKLLAELEKRIVKKGNQPGPCENESCKYCYDSNKVDLTKKLKNCLDCRKSECQDSCEKLKNYINMRIDMSMDDDVEDKDNPMDDPRVKQLKQYYEEICVPERKGKVKLSKNPYEYLSKRLVG